MAAAAAPRSAAVLRVASADNHALYELSAPAEALVGGEPRPREVCLVVDTSYSMEEAANPAGEGAMKLFSKLDVVKHALRAIVQSLGPDDSVSIVSFDSTVTVRMAPTPVDAAGLEQATGVINNLVVAGTTALWKGLRAGLETLRNTRDSPGGRRATCLLLTDGMPQPAEPKGELNELRDYMRACADMDGDSGRERQSLSFHCFGIGYDLDSALLEGFAAELSGTYGFIPDAGMVGTVVINSLANAAASQGRARLRLGGVKPGDVLGDLVVEADGDDAVVHVGDLCGGQKRHVLVRTGPGAPPAAELSFAGDEAKPEPAAGEVEDGPAAVDRERARCEFVDKVKAAARLAKISLDDARIMMVKLAREIEPLGHPCIEDLTGQVSEAFETKEAFTRWGKHYLPSLIGAHRDERCNNFKDIGIQGYAGDDFMAWRDKLDDLFNNLPPPTPSRSESSSSWGGTSGGAAVGQPVNFAASFNYSGNGCFAAETLVDLADGSRVRVDTLRKGMAVRTPAGGSAVVRCVTKHVSAGGDAKLVRLPGSGLTLTPWHPVRLAAQGAWSFPAWHAEAKDVPCEAVWNVVLEEGAGSIIVDGVEACTLGHGLMEDVVRHPYWGTPAVVRDIADLDPAGFVAGLVTVQPEDVKRRADRNTVCRLSRATPTEGSARAVPPASA